MTVQDRKVLWLMVAGFTVWSGAFVLLYALQALGCEYRWPHHRMILVAAFVFSILILGWLSLRGSYATGEPATTLSVCALWLNRAALGAGGLIFLPVTFTSHCL